MVLDNELFRLLRTLTSVVQLFVRNFTISQSQFGPGYHLYKDKLNPLLNIAALVTATALQTNAENTFDFVEALNVYYCRETGYFFKPGGYDFYHAASQYCYRYDQATGSAEWIYNEHWSEDVGCLIDLNVYEVLQDILETVVRNEANVDAQSHDIPLDSYSYGDMTSDYMQATEDNIIPCIRAVVVNSEVLDQGTFFVITVQGALIGRDSHCDVVLTDKGVLPEHCRVEYDEDGQCYVLNIPEQHSVRKLSVSTETASDPHLLKHLDLLFIGRCTLCMHIHRGFNTCVDCEPGLMKLAPKPEATLCTVKLGREKMRRKELRLLKQKYGLTGPSNPQHILPSSSFSYVDRAKIRRRIIGSDNPYADSTKPVIVSSVRKPVSAETKGFKMLTKMGWQKGESLGKHGVGIKEPICLLANVGSAGLGSTSGSSVATDDPNEAKRRLRWTKAKERYERID
ncbi:unnamed protein product [Soboliphyme baturini]|uniref:G-patch domain-containing protein n=1 Tax=Soboliphyme baturini TaxID=241478 RepID=A0A183INI2_9BILA|nr:unnamed protein product [Soboliphyme baturini]